MRRPESNRAIEKEKKTWNTNASQNTDMEQLVEMVDLLSERIKIIEENQAEGVKEANGKFTKKKSRRNADSVDFLGDELQPLEQIPNDPESIVVIMKWLQYLVERLGKNNLPDVLGYYVDIGWISDDVRLDLISYSKGIIEEQNQKGSHSTHLPTRDHLQSLLFIQKLKGVQLDDRFLSKIERDMEKLAKSLEEYRIK
jgi:archaellum component FlaD/FlaE